MCGILFYHCNVNRVNSNKFTQALKTLSHRGPDSINACYVADNHVALGHSRLSINGGELGQQPLTDISKNWLAVVNGEIYNNRSELTALGVSFQSESDSEVLLQHFINTGIAGLHQLDGEFAFALWHKTTKRAYLGRDRHGIKPLFYTIFNGQVLAASEIKALLAYGVPAKWNSDYLSHSEYFVHDANQTCIEGIFNVPAGSVLEITAQGVTTHHYQQQSPLNPSSYATNDLSYIEACQQFEQLLLSAVQKRLHHGNSTACYLSSGIDSSMLLAIAAQSTSALTSYTLKLDDAQLDESQIAQQLAKHLGVEHHLVEVTDQRLADNFENAIYHCEMPVPNSNVAAKYYLSKHLQKSGQKVVLTGEGADESLLGYGFFRQDLTSAYINTEQLPQPWLDDLLPIFRKLGYLPSQMVHAVHRGCLLTSLRTTNFRQQQSGYLALLDSIKCSKSTIQNSQQLHYRSVFQSYNLACLADRTEMAHGIEGRPAFLDNDLVNFIHTLPQAFKFQHGKDKRILRDVATKYLPTFNTQIEKKPFITPAGSLKIKGAMANLCQHYLSTIGESLPFYHQQKVSSLYQQALTLPPQQQAQLDPLFMHLTSLCILQSKFGISL